MESEKDDGCVFPICYDENHSWYLRYICLITKRNSCIAIFKNKHAFIYSILFYIYTICSLTEEALLAKHTQFRHYIVGVWYSLLSMWSWITDTEYHCTDSTQAVVQSLQFISDELNKPWMWNEITIVIDLPLWKNVLPPAVAVVPPGVEGNSLGRDIVVATGVWSQLSYKTAATIYIATDIIIHVLLSYNFAFNNMRYFSVTKSTKEEVGEKSKLWL